MAISAGEVRVNNQLLTEPYIASLPAYEGSWQVPADQLFVLGDNRNRSSDSHIWGFVPMESVVGRAVVIYWPLGSVRILSHDDIAQAYP